MPATIVTCIEAGPLEGQVLRMAHSLRTWGGWLKDAQFLAIKPRAGLPLRRATHAALRTLNVDFHNTRNSDEFHWYHFLNKPKCCLAAERLARHDQILWLDADILLSKSPEELRLAPDESFAASVVDKNVGTTGPDDPLDTYWHAFTRAVNVDIANLPFIPTHLEKTPIRLYFNSGVMAFRKSAGFGQNYLDTTRRALRARIKAPGQPNIYFHEQMSPPMFLAATGLKWRNLSLESNCTMTGRPRDPSAPDQTLANASILHYHDCMTNVAYWPTFLAKLRQFHPHLADYLQPLGPLADKPALWKAPAATTLRAWRSFHKRRFINTCQVPTA